MGISAIKTISVRQPHSTNLFPGFSLKTRQKNNQ